MKNNTNIRLHLSKNLFETIAKEVLAEAKVNGGGAYTEMVKTPKAKKEKATKMEEMSSKEKMAKGLYKEEDMDEAIDFPDAHKYTYRLSDGNCIRINP